MLRYHEHRIGSPAIFGAYRPVLASSAICGAHLPLLADDIVHPYLIVICRTVYRSLVNYSRLFDVYLSVSTTSAPELNGQQKK